MRSSWILIILGCTWLACPCTPVHAQSASQWRARQMDAIQKSDSIMREADKRTNVLAQFQFMRNAYATSRSPAFQLIFSQYLSWYQTFVGDYQDAARSFSITEVAQPDDRPSPLDDPHYSAQPALTAIPALARNYRAVFFNEAHNIPLTRTLTVQLLAKLRAQGFDYFAAETVYQTDTGLQSRGYPVGMSGFYTEEPICAEMVRTALRLGYKVIGYDALSDATGDAREAEQARNIYEQVFKNHPDAKLVLDAGYAHILESGPFQGGSSMAEHLEKLLHIDVLTVEQTMLYGHPSARDDHPYYAEVMRRLQPKEPVVFISKTGQPWSLRPGYDLSVWFPPQIIRRGRPTWLALGGERKPYDVSGEACHRHYPCLVEARYANEGDDAIPADRLVLDPVPLDALPSERVTSDALPPSSQLYLRPGKYRLTYTDADATRLNSLNITVGKEQESSRENPDVAPQHLTTSSSPACDRAGSPTVAAQARKASCPDQPGTRGVDQPAAAQQARFGWRLGAHLQQRMGSDIQ
ncbi:MAG: hypothetical protein ABI178_00830 [Rhodanobacter sp.]